MIRKTISYALAFITLAMIVFAILTTTATAVPACPDPISFTQPNGAEIQLTLHGDEFLNWSEDASGNLIIFDEDKNGYCYANWTDGGAVSTGEMVAEPVEDAAPSSPKFQREKGADIPDKVLRRASRLREKIRPGQDLPLMAPAPPSPSGAPVVNSIENLRRNVLIIHVRWGDESNIAVAPLTGQQLYDRVFNSNTRSVNSYYKELFASEEDIILPANVTNPLGGYQGIIEVTLSGAHTNAGGDNAKQLSILQKAVTAAAPYIDFSKYDTNNDKTLQTSELSIGVIVHGYEAASTSTTPNFWGVSYTASYGRFNGINIRNTFGMGAYHASNNNRALTIGILCHELGHSAYGFADTYDYGTAISDGTSNGQGYWSLMSAGNWASQNGENIGASPAYVDAYNLVYYKLVTPGVISGTMKNVRLENHLDIYKVTNTVKGSQYFLLQQRKYATVNNYDRGAFYSIDRNSSSSSGGLMILHIDEAVNISQINDKNTHYRAGIEEAHGGTQHLQTTQSTRGGLNDLWGKDYHDFSGTSDPSSGLYSAFTRNTVPPNQNTASGVAVTNIAWNSTGRFTTFDVVDEWAIIEEPLVTVRGKVRSYNPGSPTTVKLISANKESTHIIEAKEIGFGQETQDFVFDDVAPGTYSLVITKDGHTSFTVEHIFVTDDDEVDLADDDRPEARVMTLRCGDINNDGYINDNDLTTLWMAENYNKPTAAAHDPQCDLDGDGYINDADLTILWMAYNYNKGAVLVN